MNIFNVLSDPPPDPIAELEMAVAESTRSQNIDESSSIHIDDRPNTTPVDASNDTTKLNWAMPVGGNTSPWVPAVHQQAPSSERSQVVGSQAQATPQSFTGPNKLNSNESPTADCEWHTPLFNGTPLPLLHRDVARFASYNP